MNTRIQPALVLLALILPATSMAAPELAIRSVTGACPGDHEISIRGLTPGGEFALVTADAEGAGVGVPGCRINTDIGPSGIALRVRSSASPSGTYSVTPSIPAPFCGVVVQAIDLAACEGSNVGDFLSPPDPLALDCACSGDYRKGDRVVATLDSPAGAAGLTWGHGGTVIAGQDSPGGLEVLIEWDAWDSGHDGNCAVSDCGECVDSPTSNRWWVGCSDIAQAGALPCACGGIFDEGDRVVASGDEPAGASGVLAGDAGTIIAGNEGVGGLEILVEWDGWTDGHDGNCATADCGTCEDATETSRWYVACDDVLRAGTCENMGWKEGEADWSCPAGMRMPAWDEYRAVESCIGPAEPFAFDYYHDIAIEVGGCDCKWNEDWCGQPSIETMGVPGYEAWDGGGRMCGDFDQLHMCVTSE